MKVRMKLRPKDADLNMWAYLEMITRTMCNHFFVDLYFFPTPLFSNELSRIYNSKGGFSFIIFFSI